MSVDTHGRWPWVAAALVMPSWAAALVRRGDLARGDAWVAALGLPILVSHQTEEWVRPGGFLPFSNERLLGSGKPTWPLTERIAFHVNVTMGWGSAIAAAVLWRRSAAPAAFVLVIEAGNAAMHAGMAVRERGYNPGLVTAMALMGTHASFGAHRLAGSGRLSRGGCLLATTAGIAFTAGLPAAMKARMRRAAKVGAL